MQFVFFLNILLSLIIEIKPMIPTSVKRGRSQSMRPLVGRSKSNQPSQSARSSTSSAGSSSSMIQSIPLETDSKTKPVVASEIKEKKAMSKAVNFQPEAVVMDEAVLMNEAESMRRVSRINLDEVSAATHSERLNPLQDGVYARVRRILQQYGIPVGVGTAVGVGLGVGAGIGEYQIRNNFYGNVSTTRTLVSTTTTKVNTPTTSKSPMIISSTTVSSDEIINPL